MSSLSRLICLQCALNKRIPQRLNPGCRASTCGTTEVVPSRYPTTETMPISDGTVCGKITKPFPQELKPSDRQALDVGAKAPTPQEQDFCASGEIVSSGVALFENCEIDGVGHGLITKIVGMEIVLGSEAWQQPAGMIRIA